MGNDLSKMTYYPTAVSKIKDVQHEFNPLYSFWQNFEKDMKAALRKSRTKKMKRKMKKWKEKTSKASKRMKKKIMKKKRKIKKKIKKSVEKKDDRHERWDIICSNERFSMAWTRQVAIQFYGYAIPDEACLNFIKKYAATKKIIDMGCGLGYFSYMLRKKGCSVDAVDTKEEFLDVSKYWIQNIIEMDGEEYLRKTNTEDVVLLLVWPRECDNFVKEFHGEYIIWIGETDGCTGQLSDDLEDSWEVLENYYIPTWTGLRDHMLIYRRI